MCVTHKKSIESSLILTSIILLLPVLYLFPILSNPLAPFLHHSRMGGCLYGIFGDSARWGTTVNPDKITQARSEVFLLTEDITNKAC